MSQGYRQVRVPMPEDQRQEILDKYTSYQCMTCGDLLRSPQCPKHPEAKMEKYVSPEAWRFLHEDLNDDAGS